MAQSKATTKVDEKGNVILFKTLAEMASTIPNIRTDFGQSLQFVDGEIVKLEGFCAQTINDTDFPSMYLTAKGKEPREYSVGAYTKIVADFSDGRAKPLMPTADVIPYTSLQEGKEYKVKLAPYVTRWGACGLKFQLVPAK